MDSVDFSSTFEERISIPGQEYICLLGFPASFQLTQRSYCQFQYIQAEVPVNWCPALGTVLANEEVVDGVSERGGHPVIRKVSCFFILGLVLINT